ncbi:hypothetical protein LTR36_010145 [Oleoguttula mirabilis]|uniref:Uncharacterized protein n=1 Tax=Oleoguttula mirabilis TaxID=1507867 RepID=A0AAV9JS34_9PEZI|nr:hypothetical protein LTR36_010145 [Oleoguttula mirabilis]
MKRKAQRQSGSRSKRGRYIAQKPALMTLPTELREMIFYFAIVEDEPLIAYKHYDGPLSLMCEKDMPSTVQQTITQPGEPSLTFVSRQARKEARPIFWRDNTFLFNVAAPLQGPEDIDTDDVRR